MADAQAIIVLTGGDQIETQLSVDEIRAGVADAPRGDVSFMRVVDVRGQDHWVNAREIVQFHEPADQGSARRDRGK